ncbi:MAG: MbcA/ParS/Xre antitoxin family protein [Elusimicrobiota bacterium]
MPIEIPTKEALAVPHGSAVARKAIYEALRHLMADWDLGDSEVADVLHLHSNTIKKWLADKSIPMGKPPFAPHYEALLHLLAIHRSLSAMFSKAENQRVWLTATHQDFGAAPLEKMRESMEGLILVRQYLDYVRGRGA